MPEEDEERKTSCRETYNGPCLKGNKYSTDQNLLIQVHLTIKGLNKARLLTAADGPWRSLVASATV